MWAQAFCAAAVVWSTSQLATPATLIERGKWWFIKLLFHSLSQNLRQSLWCAQQNIYFSARQHHITCRSKHHRHTSCLTSYCWLTSDNYHNRHQRKSFHIDQLKQHNLNSQKLLNLRCRNFENVKSHYWHILQTVPLQSKCLPQPLYIQQTGLLTG